MKPKKKILNHRTRLSLIKLVIAVSAVLLLTLPSAAGLPKVDMGALVTVIGLDKTETDGLKCTAEIILPVEGGGATGESIVVEGEGRTLSTVIENISISIGRKLDLHHCALIIIGKDKAEAGILDEMEYLLSAGKVSPGIRLILSGNKDACEFVQMLTEYTQKMDADNLIKYLGYGAHNYSQELVLFLSETHSKSQSAVMPCIEMGDKAENMKAVEGDKAKTSKQDEEKEEKEEKAEEKESGNNQGGESGGGGGQGGESGGGESGAEKEKPTLIKKTEKIGVFAEGKLKTVWESRVTSGLAWIDPETKYGVLLLDDISINGKKIERLSCFLVKKKIRLKADFAGDAPVLRVNVDAQFQIEERNKLYSAAAGGDGEISKAVMTVITRELEKHIKEDILSVLEKSKKDGCDGLLLHDKFYRYAHKKYLQFIKDGRDLLSECAVGFKFDIKLN